MKHTDGIQHLKPVLFFLWLLVMTVALPDSRAFAHERYIVSGASGRLGEGIVKELLRRGVPAQDLILVSHRPEKLAEYAKLGASVREGDLTRPETLASAYAGGTQMVLVAVGLGYKDPRPVLHKRGIDAAVKAGVKHIVYTSWISAATSKSPISQDHFLTEQALRASGAKWTILRYGEYADLWVLGAARKMVTTGQAVQPPDERFSAAVLYSDCAAAAAGALLKPAAVNKVYEITGPERITQTDIARVTSEVTGRKIEVIPGKAGAGRVPPGPPPPGAPPSPPPAGGEPDLPDLSPAQLAANVAGFRQLVGRDPEGLRQMIEEAKPELLSASGAVTPLPAN